MIRVAQGHTLTGLAPLVVGLRVEREVAYSTEYAADGLAYATGGASAVLIGDVLDDDELAALLTQFGLSLDTPSALATVVLPDAFRVPQPFYGVVTVSAPERRTWWAQVRVEFSGLVRAT